MQWFTSISSSIVLHDDNSFINFLVACRSFFSCLCFSLLSVIADDDVWMPDCGDVGNENEWADDGVDGGDIWPWCEWSPPLWFSPECVEFVMDVDCESNKFDVGDRDLETTFAAPVDDRTELVTTDDVVNVWFIAELLFDDKSVQIW